MSVNELPRAAFIQDTTDNTLLETLEKSGHLIERGAPENKEAPLSNTGLSCCDLSPDVGQKLPCIEQQPNWAAQYNPFRFTARCDWLQGTFAYESRDALGMFQARLAEIFKDSWEENCGAFTSGMKFDDSAKSVAKLIMAWQLPDPEKEIESQQLKGWLAIPGSALDRLMNKNAVDNLFLLFDLLATGHVTPDLDIKLIYGWKCTRLDTSIDDFEKKVRPEDLRQIVGRGDFAGFKHKGHFDKIKNKWIPPCLDYQESSMCDSNGNVVWAGTQYIGSKQGNKTLYIYDKFLQSEGKLDCVRWEVRWKDELADVRFRRIYHELRENREGIGNIFASMTVGAVDFVDRQNADSKWAAARVKDLPRYAFWQEFVDALGSIHIPISAPEVTAEKVVGWINYQVATSLAALSEINGVDKVAAALSRLREFAKRRLKGRHMAFISQGKIDGFDIEQYVEILIQKYSTCTDSC